MTRWIVLVVLLATACGNGDIKKNQPPPCGDGYLSGSEKCDPAIAAGQPGACPTECPSSDDGCGGFILNGNPARCSAECVPVEPACGEDDGCCPGGCDSTSDADCTNTCGNGMVEGGETCDGDCPTTCDDRDTCTVDSFAGSADTCSLRCMNEPSGACGDADGCCPAGCTSDDDADCSDSCGDGTLDPGELCDGDCPTDCNDGVACTTDRLVGSAASCNAQCVHDAVSTCQSGDGCCPAGCSSANDADCACTPRTCADMGWVCGQLDDLCGSTRNCGACNANESCDNGSCVPNNPTGAIGDPCTSDGACQAGLCFTAAREAYPGGYCTKGCQADTDCGAGAVCSVSACAKACTLDSDCRQGYGCFTRLGGTKRACFPLANGTGSVGQACTTTNSCSGGTLGFCGSPASGYRDGYCLRECNAANACPSGSHCANDDGGSGICVRNCSTDGDCRGAGTDGYMCYDFDNDTVKECFVAGTGTTPVGGPCQDTGDCSGGADGRCGTPEGGFPGGYCTRYCGTDNACPAGSACGFLLGGGYCLDTCSTDNDCRTEYTCQQDFVNYGCWPAP